MSIPVDKHGIPTNKDLNLNYEYNKRWNLCDSIREVLQNTIDGSKEYSNYLYADEWVIQPLFFSPNLNNKDDPWHVHTECTCQPDKWGSLNLKSDDYQAYKSTLILVREDFTVKDIDSRVMKKITHSNEDRKGYEKWVDDGNKVILAFIQITYLVEKSKWDPNKVVYGQIPGSILVKLVAENRAVPSLQKRMHSFFGAGSSNKRDNNNLAGLNGEGLKVGANRLVVNGSYTVHMEANGIRRE